MKLKTIIVDDEFNARENLQIMLEDFCPDAEIIGSADSAEEARNIMKNDEPHLIFLDINMPKEDGFSFLQSIPDRKFSVVFTTAHNEHALKAFKADAIDFLEKPINIEELTHAFEKAQKYHESTGGSSTSEDIKDLLEKYFTKNSLGKVSVPSKDGFILADNADIIHLEASDNYTNIYLTDGKRYMSSKNIKMYEENLDPTVFFRVHKSHIVNMKHHLKEFSRADGNYAVLSNGISIPVSRRKLSEFMSRINTI